MRLFLACCFLLFHLAMNAQQGNYFEEIRKHRLALNEEFADPKKSPLTKEGLAHFDSLNFFPVDTNFRLWAHVVRTPDSLPFKMLTTTARLADYRQFGWLHFNINETLLKIPVYESLRLKGKTGFADYLFLPFTDLTNGEETYGGGRFLDLHIPEGDSVLVDFNKAYNPYCAYNSRYSCPIPPEENHLPLRVTAGILTYGKKH